MAGRCCLMPVNTTKHVDALHVWLRLPRQDPVKKPMLLAQHVSWMLKVSPAVDAKQSGCNLGP